MSRALALILLLPTIAFGQEYTTWPEHHERERTYHVLHYKLTIDIDEQTKTCEGIAAITLVPA